MAAGEASTTKPRQEKQYDYLLKFLLVGDSDVGKQEILSGLEDGAAESPFCSGSGENLIFGLPADVSPELLCNSQRSHLEETVCVYVCVATASYL